MKKVLFAVATLVGAFAPAHADPLPEAYLGKWCFLQSVEQIGGNVFLLVQRAKNVLTI
jgi:hypothetical protein